MIKPRPAIRILLLAVLLLAVVDANAQLAVGKWRDHLSYNKLFKVVATTDRIYASASGGLFYYDVDDLTMTRLNKNTIFNDVGVNTFAYDAQTRNLVVAYSNANIDIMKDDVVVNINDIKRGNISGSKKINNIAFYNRCAYLACGFGIVVVDLVRHEIKETYYIGEGGTYINVNDIVFTDSLIVAATDNGIMTADKDSRFLNIVNNWTVDNTSLLAGQRVVSLAVSGGRLLAVTDDGNYDRTVYRETDGLAFAPWLSDTIRSVRVCGNRVVVSRRSRVDIYDAGYNLQYSIGNTGWVGMNPNDAILGSDGRLWIAHDWAALVEMDPANPEESLSSHSPRCPTSDNVFRLVSYNDDMMVCPGGHRTTYAGVYLPAELYTYNNDKWHDVSDPDGLLDNLRDIVDVAVNPRRPSEMTAASWGYGLVDIKNGSVTAFYNDQNSDGALVRYYEGDYSTIMTGGVAYDERGTLWATNALQGNSLVAHYNDGTWRSFNTFSMVGSSYIDHIICDSIGGLKLFWGRSNKVFVHDGDSLMAWINPNNGAKTETSSVNCLVQDHNGNLWMGTNKGIKVIYNLQQAMANGGHGEMSPVSCNNIIYNENGITEYLLVYENITSIAVDGANRKWVGTATGGLFLLSATGLEQIEHFTSANSPLFSDKIVTLGIMPWTGELFIGTDKGLQSYRTTATYAYSEPQSDIHAYPNPVRPDYDGPIAIKGFTRNGLVHITDAAGHTVYSTKANGGQAIWDGRTNSGVKVASGVYYVYASAVDGTMRSVAKILIVR